jgi:hypothetical protein
MTCGDRSVAIVRLGIEGSRSFFVVSNYREIPSRYWMMMNSERNDAKGSGRGLFMALDRLCCLAVTAPSYSPSGSVCDFRLRQIFWVAVGLERSLLSSSEDKWGVTG